MLKYRQWYLWVNLIKEDFINFPNYYPIQNLSIMQDILEALHFLRKWKISLQSILLYCLSKKGLTTSFELRNYLKEKIEMFMQLSVQGYLQHRKHLNLEIFLILSGNTLWFSIILVDQNYKNMLSDC